MSQRASASRAGVHHPVNPGFYVSYRGRLLRTRKGPHGTSGFINSSSALVQDARGRLHVLVNAGGRSGSNMHYYVWRPHSRQWTRQRLRDPRQFAYPPYLTLNPKGSRVNAWLGCHQLEEWNFYLERLRARRSNLRPVTSEDRVKLDGDSNFVCSQGDWEAYVTHGMVTLGRAKVGVLVDTYPSGDSDCSETYPSANLSLVTGRVGEPFERTVLPDSQNLTCAAIALAQDRATGELVVAGVGGFHGQPSLVVWTRPAGSTTWLAPQVLATSGESTAERGQPIFDRWAGVTATAARGRVWIAVGRNQDAGGNHNGTFVVNRTPDGIWSQVTRVPGTTRKDDLSPQLALSDNGRLRVLYGRSAKRHHRGIRVSKRSVGGDWARPHFLTRHYDTPSSALLTDDDRLLFSFVRR